MNAKWITITEQPTQTALYIFKKVFTCPEEVESFPIELSADTRYRFYLNGIELAQGPCQGGEELTYYETLDAKDALRKGENTIEIRVLHVVGDEFISTYRREKPALFFNGQILGCDFDSPEISSDTSFTCERVTSLRFVNCSGMMRSLAPFEYQMGETRCEPMQVIESYQPNYATGFMNKFGLTDQYLLSPRPIPLLLPENKSEMQPVRDYITSDGQYNLILDAGAYTTAMVSCDFCAEKDTQFTIFYAECAMTRGSDGKLHKEMRDNPSGEITAEIYDTVRASGSAQSYEPFWYRAFRFVRVEFDKKPAHFRMYHTRYAYNFIKHAKNDGIGHFESDDPIYSDMWRVSVNTLECSAHEMFMDCPYYEQQQYAMDGGLESIFAWRISNDSSLQKKIIIDMAQSQQLNGFIQANYPSTTRQIIPSFSLYYVMMCREYLRNTGEVEFVRKMTGICDRVLEGFHALIGDKGLVESRNGWFYVDWVDGWIDGSPIGASESPITVYSMLYATALETQAQVCEACSRHGLAMEYRMRREMLLRAINEYCYDSEKRLYTDVVGRKNYSWHTTVWAILSGAVSQSEAGELIDRTMAEGTASKCSFSMNYYLLRALEAAGRYEAYAPQFLAGWRTMLDLHCTTWCESVAYPRSECHGWSSAPIYEMSAMLLGVYPTENGYAKVRVKPTPLGLDHASGRVPTPWGYIDVEWHYEGEKMKLTVSASKTIEIEACLPDGTTVTARTKALTV